MSSEVDSPVHDVHVPEADFQQRCDRDHCVRCAPVYVSTFRRALADKTVSVTVKRRIDVAHIPPSSNLSKNFPSLWRVSFHLDNESTANRWI